MTLFFVTVVFAQRDTLKFGWGISFPEYNKADISEFNNYMIANNFPTKDYWPFSFQLGGAIYYKKMRVSLTSGGLINQSEKNGDTTIQYTTNFISIDIAYDALTSKKLRIYSFAGYKMTGLTYDFKISQTYNTMQNYLQTQLNNKSLVYSKNNLVFGLGIEFGNNIAFGLKSGFYVPLDNGYWSFDNNSIKENTPTIDFKYFVGFYWTIRGLKFKK